MFSAIDIYRCVTMHNIPVILLLYFFVSIHSDGIECMQFVIRLTADGISIALLLAELVSIVDKRNELVQHLHSQEQA